MAAAGESFAQLRGLFLRMSPVQRIMVATLPVILFLSMTWIIAQSPHDRLAPLALGKSMSDEELRAAENLLVEQGLTEFQRRDGQLWGPESQLDSYNAALLVGGNIPDGLGSDWSTKLENTSLFTTRAQLEELKESDLKDELSRIITAIPGIEQATVRWAEETPTKSFSRRQRRKATVFVVPSDRTQLTDDLVHGLRHGVANAVSDLEPEHVTVFDVTAGQAYTLDWDGNTHQAEIRRTVNDLSRTLRRQISDRLSYIDGVRISVDVLQEQLVARPAGSAGGFDAGEPDSRLHPGPNGSHGLLKAGMAANPVAELNINHGSSVRPALAVRTREQTRGVTTIPVEAIQVSIGIPRRYAQSILELEGVGSPSSSRDRTHYLRSLERRQQFVEADVRQTVAVMLGGSSENIHVHSFVETGDDAHAASRRIPEPNEARWQTWGIAVGLGMIGLVGFGLLSRFTGSTIGRTHYPESQSEPIPPGPVDPLSDSESKRKQVEGVVRDRPEMAAAVISRWMESSGPGED